MNNERFIPVFIDAKPSENLEPSDKKTLCFVGLLSNSMSGVKKLKGYKDTKRKLKIDSAKRIIEHFNTTDDEVDAIGYASRTNGQFILWACDVINKSRKRINAEWEVVDNIPTHLLWNGKRIDRSTVLGLSAYAVILPLIALRAEIITSNETNKKIKLCLDNLPKNSLLGMNLMKEFKDEQMIADMWKQNMSDGTSFEVGTFHKYLGLTGKWHPAKKHPNSILVDWFAVSCLAKINPSQLQKEGSYSDIEIEELARIWDVAKSDDIRDLDDKELQQKVKEYNNV
ncbi:MAG: hypothetical protein HRT93_06275 [Piscirickettsiaceae bacterium]|nr:hypothetical protein [Piscirickettsiaceae bacterium]